MVTALITYTRIENKAATNFNTNMLQPSQFQTYIHTSYKKYVSTNSYTGRTSIQDYMEVHRICTAI